MYKGLQLIISFLLLLPRIGISQTPFISIKSVPGFKADDIATSSFDSVSNIYHLNLQNGNKIYRKIYDSSFNLLSEYSFTSGEITFSEKVSPKANFISPLCTSKGYFEIFFINSDNGILVYKPDFAKKKDSLFAEINFEWIKKGGEKLLSIMPDFDGLKILTYSNELNALKIYQWFPGDSIKTFSFTLPEKSLSKEEEKIYAKECRIKFRSLWDHQLVSAKINSIQSLPKGNNIFYSKNRIYILFPIPYSMGIYILSIDLDKKELTAHNYFINSLKDNAGDNIYIKKNMVSMVFDSTLVIQNSSYLRFEYLFFNINTHELLKKYSIPVEDSIYLLVHSNLAQKGTYGSRDEEKEIKNEKKIMRKTSGSFSFMNLSSKDQDSAVFTLATLKFNPGVAGTILMAATFPISPGIAITHIGNLQDIPYLTSSRCKLLYAHSLFNIKTLEPSKDSSVTTALDKILDTFAMRELGSNSSFFVQKNDGTLIGILNKERTLFDIFRFQNTR